MSTIDPNLTPALIPPDGRQSNFDSPNSQLKYLILTSVICLSLTAGAITARIFVKGYIFKKLQLEDCMI